MATTRVQHDPQGTWKKIIQVAFPGNKRIHAGKPRIIVSTSGAPDCASPVGTLCYDASTGNCYICTVASGTWVKINA